jgi:hypothetical protein
MHNKHGHKYLYQGLAILAVGLLALPDPARAEVDWFSFTGDNDTFIGEDNGYTNGLFFSWFDGPEGEKAEPGYLARAMLWSLPEYDSPSIRVSIKTVGQTMATPEEITQDPPIGPPTEMPYAGMLAYTDTFLKVRENYADRISVTIGVIGEYSFAEQSQTFVHEIIDADEPCCWDTQLNNEIVFQFSRGRVWKTWVSASGNADFLLAADARLGTIQSSVGAGAMIRYGRQLKNSYATALLVSSRTTNPVATQTGWYLFAGAMANYVGNMIFLDGNTFDNDGQESVDYDAEQLAVTMGLAYSWNDFSLTFAMNDLNAAANNAADKFTQYGTLTLAWKLD